MADQAVGVIQDGLSGAVILGEDDLLSFLVIILELENIANGGAAESVYGLVVVTHDDEVPVGGGRTKALDELVLGKIGVLKFIHKDILELVLVFFEDGWPRPKKVNGMDDEITKIKQGVFPFEGLIGFVGGKNFPVAVICFLILRGGEV